MLGPQPVVVDPPTTWEFLDGETIETVRGRDGFAAAERTERLARDRALAGDVAPLVDALFDEHDDPRDIADALRALAALDDERRFAGLRIVRARAGAWWTAGRIPDEGPAQR